MQLAILWGEPNEVSVAVLNYHINEVISCHLTWMTGKVRMSWSYKFPNKCVFSTNYPREGNTRTAARKNKKVYSTTSCWIFNVTWEKNQAVPQRWMWRKGSGWRRPPPLRANIKTSPVNTTVWWGYTGKPQTITTLRALKWAFWLQVHPLPDSSVIPIHFNYPVIPTFFSMSRLAQAGNLQLHLPHLRPTSGGGRETSSNGMKCHSVVGFVTARWRGFGEI